MKPLHVSVKVAFIAIPILLYFWNRIGAGDVRTNLYSNAPQSLSYNYEKYGVLGGLGFVAFIILLLRQDIYVSRLFKLNYSNNK